VEDHVTVLSHVQKSSIAKEVQMQVRNTLDLSDSEGCSSSGNWPGFVWLVEFDPGKVISCTHAPLEAEDLRFPTRPHTPHLEFICPFIQSRNRIHLQPRPNPAKGRLRVCLDIQFNSNFCETLGHENTLISESNHGPKVGCWADFCFLHPDRNEGLKGGPPGLLSSWTHVSSLPASCEWQSFTVLGSFGRLDTPLS